MDKFPTDIFPENSTSKVRTEAYIIERSIKLIFDNKKGERAFALSPVEAEPPLGVQFIVDGLCIRLGCKVKQNTILH